MTRLTVGEFKAAARNPDQRRVDGSSGVGFPTPFPVANRAVRRLHSEGPTIAHVYLNQAFDRSLYWGPQGPGSARGWANSVRECLDNYITMTAGDTRPTLNTTISTDVDVGDGEIGVALDIVLLDPGGYVGRYLLWDKPVPSVDEIEILAAPMSIALQSELGDDRVLGMEIWHLRSSAKWFVPTSDAVARLADVGAIVSQYLS